MSDFQELIKNMDKCRDYVRNFFVYGFKSRSDFPGKSARTYDDERRRIVSWLEEYIKEDFSENGRSKNISLQIDQKLLDTNPLFRVWQAASFTDRDLILHFFILKLLEDKSAAYSAPELSELLMDRYVVDADMQIVRRKCNEYVSEGLLTAVRDGRTLLYRRGIIFDELSDNTASVSDMVKCLSLDLPFGFLGDSILSARNDENSTFRVKHSFPTFTLEDGILLSLLEAIHDKKHVEIFVQSNRRMNAGGTVTGLPLQIFVSMRTGRRFVCLYHPGKRGPFSCYRLDQIKNVQLCEAAEAKAFNTAHTQLENRKPFVWGTSFSASERTRGPLQKLVLTIHADDKSEDFIVQRLVREGEGGSVERIEKNTYRYEKNVYDALEMFPWIRSFTGRIIDLKIYGSDGTGIHSENLSLEEKFRDDLERTYMMYGV